MNKVAGLPEQQRAELFERTADALKMAPIVVEKDFWVCWVLKKLFASDEIGPKIIFKGGTSLSKVFGVIERFSEDIDLILDWNQLPGESPDEERSKTRQGKFNRQTQETAQTYLQDLLLPLIQELLDPVCTAAMNGKQAQTIDVRYPATFKADYLRPEVCLEIGPLAAWVPHETYTIMPYAAEQYPDQFEEPQCEVRAIKAERTFWEKATILHQEANRPNDKPLPPRYSRHYYDLAKMADSAIRGSALADLELLNDVVAFKKKFYPCSWANYDEARPGSFTLMPPESRRRALRDDYRSMEIMIFGDVPTFDWILQQLADLETEINQQ